MRALSPNDSLAQLAKQIPPFVHHVLRNIELLREVGFRGILHFDRRPDTREPISLSNAQPPHNPFQKICANGTFDHYDFEPFHLRTPEVLTDSNKKP